MALRIPHFVHSERKLAIMVLSKMGVFVSTVLFALLLSPSFFVTATPVELGLEAREDPFYPCYDRKLGLHRRFNPSVSCCSPRYTTHRVSGDDLP